MAVGVHGAVGVRGDPRASATGARRGVGVGDLRNDMVGDDLRRGGKPWAAVGMRLRHALPREDVASIRHLSALW